MLGKGYMWRIKWRKSVIGASGGTSSAWMKIGIGAQNTLTGLEWFWDIVALLAVSFKREDVPPCCAHGPDGPEGPEDPD